MKDAKKYYIVIGLLVICLIISVVMNFTQTAKLKNGKEVAVKVGKSKITADDLYSDLKSKYAMNVLIDEIDHMLLDSKYKTDEDETSQIDNQISAIKSNYQDEKTYLQAIQNYYGVETEDEFREILSLEYKRNLAVNDYVGDKVVTDNEIQEYYDNNIIGDVKASHILIKSKAKSTDSDEEKEKKEQAALEKAQKVIEELDNGGDFSKLAKKYSDDKGTASNGGDLGYFNKDDNYEENFVTAAANLKVGEYTKEPIKTEYGYEIILKVAEKNKAKLSKVKDEIKEKLAEEKLSSDNALYYNSLAGVREDGKVVFKDAVLKRKYNNYLDRLLDNVSSSSTTN